ncbi:MAG: hypothetical protein PHH01_03555 [Patescibacteria group bacterium]|nr:hypothetical protein [Patescibacteria group bacterium]MDD5567245.1 hypothetical protein [Patescibacteria group bacterium]
MGLSRKSWITGVSFGMTSGVITTLGLLVGLWTGTNLKIAVIGGILTIAVADAFSDGLGIHVSEESKDGNTTREIWESTLATMLSKFVVAMTFLVPVLLFNLQTAVIICVIWGLFLVSVLSLFIAKSKNDKIWKVISEHVLITGLVVVLSYYLGDWIAFTFN